MPGYIANNIKRILVDGHLVLVHARYSGTPDIAGADIFRFDQQGKIVEHWLTRQVVPETVTDDSMFDGGGNPQVQLAPDKIKSNHKHLDDAYNIFLHRHVTTW